jgi:antitoxin HicB
MYRFPVTLTADSESGGFVVTFPDIPEAITQGEDVPDALKRAVDALETALSMYMDDRKDIPVPSRARAARYSVDLPPISAAKAALYRELRSSGMKKAELARKLGWQKSQVDRLLDLMHKSRLDQLEQALQVFDKVIVLDVKRRPEPRQKIRAAS